MTDLFSTTVRQTRPAPPPGRPGSGGAPKAPSWAPAPDSDTPKPTPASLEQGFLMRGHTQRPFRWSGRGLSWELGTRAYGCLQREHSYGRDTDGILQVWAGYREDREQGDAQFLARMEALEQQIEEEHGG